MRRRWERALPGLACGVLLALRVSAGESPLTAAFPMPVEEGTFVSLNPDNTDAPGRVFERKLSVTNPSGRAFAGKAVLTLRTNPQLYDHPIPEAAYGPDRAWKQPSWIVLENGQRVDDRTATDGDDFTSYGGPWAKVRERSQYIDLGRAFDGVKRISVLSGDANWYWFAEVSASEDGENYAVVPGLEKVDLHQKWGWRHFEDFAPFKARYLRFLYSNNGQEMDSMKAPATIAVYAGLAGDAFELPVTGDLVETATFDVAVPAGETVEVALKGTKPLAAGAYYAGVAVGEGDARALAGGQWLVMPEKLPEVGPASRFGMNGASPELFAKGLRQAGFAWYRFENLKWAMTSTGPDHIEFDGSVAPWHVKQDKIAEDIIAEGIQYYPYVQMTPAWISRAPGEQNVHGYPAKDFELFRKYMFQVAARYGSKKVDADRLIPHDKKTGLGYITHIELWNEADLNAPEWGPWGGGTFEEYFDFYRRGVEGAREADPDLLFSHGGWASMDMSVVGRMHWFQYPDGKRPTDFTDILNVHYYTGKADPETAIDDPNANRTGQGPTGEVRTYEDNIRTLVAWRDLYMPGKEIWMTEIGNDVGGPMGRSERYQACKLPRAIMMLLAGGVDKAFVYRESGSDASMHAGAGLYRNDRTVRPVWFTLATMIRQLDGVTERAVRLDTPPTERVYVWTLPDGGRLVTVWTAKDDGAELGIDLGDCEGVDAFGLPFKATLSADYRLGQFPLYVRVLGKTAGLDAAVAKAKARDAAWDANQKRWADLPAFAFDFGRAERIDILRDRGPAKPYVAVPFDTEWDEARGYGFAKGGAVADIWIPWVHNNKLECDGVAVGDGGATFQAKIPAGDYELSLLVRSPYGEGQKVEITDGAGAAADLALDKEHRTAWFKTTVKGGDQPVSLTLPGDTQLFALTLLAR